MKADILAHNLRSLLFQRNSLLGLCFILAVGVALQSCFLFWKQERVVVVPPNLDKAISVGAHRPSPSYLEQFGIFLGDLLLSKSAQTSGWQRGVILQHASPAFSSSLRQRLIEEEQTLKGQSASYVFFTHGVSTQPDEMQVTLEGNRVFHVGGQQVSKNKARYRLGFVFKGGRLLLDSLEEVK